MSIVFASIFGTSTQPILRTLQHTINRFVLQELGLVVEPCLTVKNYWGLLAGDDGVSLEG